MLYLKLNQSNPCFSVRQCYNVSGTKGKQSECRLFMEYDSNLLHKVASRYYKLYVISNTMDHFMFFFYDCHEKFKTVALTLK